MKLSFVKGYNKSIDKYMWVKVTDEIELDALFGLTYFGGLLGGNLYLTDRLF